MSDVSDALALSRQAHAKGRMGRKTRTIDIEAFTEALTQRRKAARLDPEFRDPAWLDDIKNVRGEVKRDPHRGSEELIRQQHVALVNYFVLMTEGPKAAARKVLTDAQIAKRVSAPKGMAPEDTHAFKQLKKEQAEAERQKAEGKP